MLSYSGIPVTYLIEHENPKKDFSEDLIPRVLQMIPKIVFGTTQQLSWTFTISEYDFVILLTKFSFVIF